MPIVPLFGKGEGYRSRAMSVQRRVNLYLEYQDDADKSAVMMLGTPGLALFANLGTAPVRGARGIGDFAYLAAGSTLYKMNNGGVFTAVGTLSSSSGRVSMTDNGTQLMIVDGVNGYIYNLNSGAFSTITDPDFPNGATTATFLSGYFLVNVPNSGRFQASAPYDGTAWDGLDFWTAEANPDNLIAVTSARGVLYLWGPLSIEFWAPSGDTRIFARIGGAGAECGIPSPWSIDRFGDNEIFLAKNRMGQFQVALLQGLNVVPVTTSDVTHDMNALTAIEGATAYSYMMDNHLFYQINFAAKSYLYNGSAPQGGEWSELASDGGARHFGEIRFEFLSKPYICDYRNGNIYSPSLDTFSDNGTPILRGWTSKHVINDLERLTVDELQIEFEAGVGLVSGQGSDPQAMLLISRDGGATYGNEHWTSIGKIGGYLTRAIWRQLGLARDMVFKLAISDPVKIAITNIAIKVR